MQYFFYKKEKREIVPVTEELLNVRAEEKLTQILADKTRYNIPSWVRESKEVYLYNTNGNIEKANALYVKDKDCVYDLSNTLNELSSKEWIPETVTVFAQKGLGASNKDAQIEKLHPAPYSYQDVARHIKFFTKEGDFVLDPFLGVGSTLKAACYENRRGLGIELNQKYADLSLKRIEVEVPDSMPFKDKQEVICGDSTKILKSLQDNTIDFVITSPPYWNILDQKDHKAKQREIKSLDTKYSDNDNDLANIDDYQEFLNKLCEVFEDCSRILKKDKYLAIVVSDFRKSEKYYMFHSDLSNILEQKSPFVLKGIKILYQRHKSIFPYGYPYSFVPNVHHQYILIFKNQKNGKK